MMILVSGGASSGKSKVAEDFMQEYYTDKYYIATMKPHDNECQIRIDRHKKLRENKGFITIEKHTDIKNIAISENSSILIECLSNLLANEMYEKNGAKSQGLDVVDKIFNDISILNEKCKNVVVVSNEVFSDLNLYDEFCLEYIDNLGKLNAKIAKTSNKVIEVVCGIILDHK